MVPRWTETNVAPFSRPACRARVMRGGGIESREEELLWPMRPGTSGRVRGSEASRGSTGAPRCPPVRSQPANTISRLSVVHASSSAVPCGRQRAAFAGCIQGPGRQA